MNFQAPAVGGGFFCRGLLHDTAMELQVGESRRSRVFSLQKNAVSAKRLMKVLRKFAVIL